MAWIESHQTLLTHRKTGRLARALGASKIATIGHLHAFWWWCVDNAPDGDLAGIDAEDIADGACWEGDPRAFLDGLLYAGFVDGDGDALRVHEWREYTGRLIDRRKKDAERKRTERTRPADVRRTSGGTVPNSTGQNPTGPETPPTAPTEPSVVAAAPPARDADKPEARGLEVKPGPKRAPPKPKPDTDVMHRPNSGLATLFDAFAALELERPKLADPKEQRAATVLLKLHKPVDVARCWRAVETGRYGDGWLGENLSFAALANMNRVANFLRAERETAAAMPKGRRLAVVQEPDEAPPDDEPLPATDPAAETLWVQASELLRGRMTEGNYRMYFSDARGVAFEGARLVVAIGNPNLLDQVELFRPLMRATLTDLSGKPADVRLVAS